MDCVVAAGTPAGADLGNNGNKGPQPPVTKYWIAMPIKLDVTQYNARPLGSVNEKNAIIRGINQSIIAWLPDCLGSVDGCMVIFCWTQVDAKTRTGMMMFVGSDADRSSHRKFAFSGGAECTGATGIQVYSFSDRPTRSSGLENTVWINTRNSPISTGIWTIIGPRQPNGLTPASRYRRMVSWETRDRSLEYRSCISFSFGCNALMARICLSCFNVRGIVTSRMKAVRTMIANPILLKRMV